MDLIVSLRLKRYLSKHTHNHQCNIVRRIDRILTFLEHHCSQQLIQCSLIQPQGELIIPSLKSSKKIKVESPLLIVVALVFP